MPIAVSPSIVAGAATPTAANLSIGRIAVGDVSMVAWFGEPAARMCGYKHCCRYSRVRVNGVWRNSYPLLRC